MKRAGYTSAAFRLARLPFADRPGYEDWYCVAGWAALGDLNAAARDARSRPAHDSVAELAEEGWGGVYQLLRGDPGPPERASWVSKPTGASYGAFVAQLAAATVWQRQLVLGPGPEFCISDAGPPDHRIRLAVS